MAQIEHKLVRCTPDDPRRCQDTSGTVGQCPYTAVEGGTHCVRHGGGSQMKSLEIASKKMYILSKWRNRLNELGEGEGVKTLREEIGILRLTLENTLERAKDAEELMMFSNRIGDLCLKIEKLVMSCARLEDRSGAMMDRSAAISFASQIVEIVNIVIREHVDEEAADSIIEIIGAQIVKAFAGIGGPVSVGRGPEIPAITA